MTLESVSTLLRSVLKTFRGREELPRRSALMHRALGMCSQRWRGFTERCKKAPSISSSVDDRVTECPISLEICTTPFSSR